MSNVTVDRSGRASAPCRGVRPEECMQLPTCTNGKTPSSYQAPRVLKYVTKLYLKPHHFVKG